jgi:hypothetical protein
MIVDLPSSSSSFSLPFFCFLFDSHTTAFFGEMCGGKKIKKKKKKRKGRPAG